MKLKHNNHKNDQTTTFPWSIWSSIPLNKRIWIYQLRNILAVVSAFFLTSIALCNASDQKAENIETTDRNV